MWRGSGPGGFPIPPSGKWRRSRPFGVPTSYLLDRSRDPSVLDEEALDALADETASAILRESARLPEREKTIVLGIVRQFESQRGAIAREG
jgi:hypothetical protein